ncbi:MAG: 6-hydroxymethylpterin diphosphokinase MptE-like protein [Marinobacter sp.]|uniref:motility associated factor glycosyltransferase family protein n=1 Tax=Marinobacter sp. TaxID=50741 RepID=UPI00299E2DB1|nr:6-hydroxymethylpterin diphosphokinase MptE-like protein [Marinobacter sp.]MDX1754699.1 6-hydroxymethylpterin diphosphokinase MptE-like protein [Marinobacter sp.]
MSESDQDVALQYLERKEKNLAYFKKYRPELHQYFGSLQLDHCELVVTPGNPDVDLVDRGRSVYRHHARAYSYSEVDRFLEENPPEQRSLTLAPPWAGSFATPRFGMRLVKEALDASPVTPEQFQGYRRGDFFPSVVFLGCGLGYHIEKMSEQADIIDAVIFEPDAERFALSLFTVDWEAISVRFRKRGCSLSFCIAVTDSEENIRRVLGGKLAEMVPLYPYFTTYYNHLANVELFRIAKDLEKDIPILAANWGSYDFEIRAFNNILHNLRSGGRYLKPDPTAHSQRPLLVIGSGPSIDGRFEDIRKIRDKVAIVSAGTGLRGLLANGIQPDFHLELDADYAIHEILSDLDPKALRAIPLLAAIDVNPLVTDLFDEVTFFFKSRNAIPGWLGVGRDALDQCSPTCTNAALSVGYALGFRSIFMFGTDYGYKDTSSHHSAYSVYGAQAETDFSKSFRAERKGLNEDQRSFPVAGVDGGEVLTRTDYYTAKRAAERFIHDLKVMDETFQAYNCSDGAVIEEADWLSRSAFLEAVAGYDSQGRKEARALLGHERCPLPAEELDKKLANLQMEMSDTVVACRKALDLTSHRSRRDLVAIANGVRDSLNRVGVFSGRRTDVSVQMMCWQLLKGTVYHFLQVGLCHGLACEESELDGFMEHWKQAFGKFLDRLPDHFERVAMQARAVDTDPWLRARLTDDEPTL